ncbi:MAG: hypothetical protein ACI9ON_001052 [Limisphaerales bacterium]|jgi:hypothetical protein
MAWRVAIFAVCLALPHSDPALEPISRESRENTLVRQKIDEKVKPFQQLSITPQPRPNFLEEQDVQSIELAFNSQYIDALSETGSTTVSIPGYGATLALAHTASRTTASGHTIQFEQDTLTGTVTRRGSRFQMTLPTFTDSFRIAGDERGSVAISSRALRIRVDWWLSTSRGSLTLDFKAAAVAPMPGQLDRVFRTISLP